MEARAQFLPAKIYPMLLFFMIPYIAKKCKFILINFRFFFIEY